MTVSACVYDSLTGEIHRTVYCPENLVELQAGEGEATVLGEATSETHYVVDGELVEYTEQERQLKSARPHLKAKWSNVSMGWVDVRTLEQRKAEKWEEIKLAREAALDSPLATPYGTFDADPKSRQNITDAVLMAKTLNELSQPSSIDFTLADNTVRTLTSAEMVQVGLLLGAQVQAAHATGRGLRVELDAAQTVAEVESVVWPA